MLPSFKHLPKSDSAKRIRDYNMVMPATSNLSLHRSNVAISRSKEKLIILGNFDMMLNGWGGVASSSGRHFQKSAARKLARLIDLKYGKVVDAPHIVVG